MGQVSVLVSVFGGETVNQKWNYYSWLVITMIIIIVDYRDIIVIIEYLWDGSTSGIFTMIVYFKALYVVSLRRPTVALLI